MGDLIPPNKKNKPSKVKCSNCNGTGKVGNKTCSKCNGNGQRELLKG